LFSSNAPFQDANSYQKLIGRFMYLINNWPNFCFTIFLLNQFLQAPTIHHHQAIQHVLRTSNPILHKVFSLFQMQKFNWKDLVIQYSIFLESKKTYHGFSLFFISGVSNSNYHQLCIIIDKLSFLRSSNRC